METALAWVYYCVPGTGLATGDETDIPPLYGAHNLAREKH